MADMHIYCKCINTLCPLSWVGAKGVNSKQKKMVKLGDIHSELKQSKHTNGVASLQI